MRHACDEWHEIKTVATAYRIGSKSKRMKVVSGQQQRAIAMSTWPNKSFDRSRRRFHVGKFGMAAAR